MGTISKRTFEEALNIEFKKFGVFGFMDVVEKDRLFSAKNTIQLYGSILKIFLVFKIILTVDDIGFVLYIKISAVKEYIFLGLYSIDSRMF
jgi:flagellar biosynthesis protein FlhB